MFHLRHLIIVVNSVINNAIFMASYHQDEPTPGFSDGWWIFGKINFIWSNLMMSFICIC
jgi:hypothetical protein